jgi:hypothetical protein
LTGLSPVEGLKVVEVYDKYGEKASEIGENLGPDLYV